MGDPVVGDVMEHWSQQLNENLSPLHLIKALNSGAVPTTRTRVEGVSSKSHGDAS